MAGFLTFTCCPARSHVFVLGIVSTACSFTTASVFLWFCFDLSAGYRISASQEGFMGVYRLRSSESANVGVFFTLER